jgi:hypothetical protein
LAARNLGSLTLDLAVKTGQFTAGMTAAERQASKSFNAIEKRAKAFGAALGVGLVTAATALTALTKSAIDNADALRDSSIQLGISTETLSAYSYAAQQTGTDLDSLSRGLKILSKNAADALKPTSEQARVFKALGISVTDATGQLKQLDELVPEVANAFAQLEDGTQKAALAQSLFGKSGLELTEFLNSGARGLEEFTDKARELGIIVGTDTANAADEFNDKLTDLKALVSGFGNQLAEELLPRLIQLVDYFNAAAKEGNTFGTSVKDLGSLFDIFIGQVQKADEVGNSFRLMLSGIETYVGLVKSAFSDLLSLNITGFFTNATNAARQAFNNLKAGFNLQADFSDVSGRVIDNRSGNARGGSNRPETGGINRAALADALAGVTAPKGSKGSGAKKIKDDVDKAKEAYDQLIANQERTIALFGQEGEAAQIAYDIKTGVLSEYTAAQQQLLLSNAQRIDQQKEMGELEDAADKRMRQESEIINEGIKATDQVIDQLEFELSLIGMRNSEIEKAIALRHLDASATDEQRQRVAELTDELIRASENQAFLDDFKEGLADAFTDFVSGAKSAKEAFGDFADALFKRALQFVADKAIQAMFDAFSGNGAGSGSSAGGGTGGGWQQWLGAIMGAFGGGKADGGSVLPGKFYRVNENGTEMFSQGGNDYLMTGSKGGMITPANKLGGVNQQNTFVFAAPTSQRTQEQIAQRTGFEVSQAQRRNG